MVRLGGTWRRSTVAYKKGSLVRSLNPVLHWEMATMEGTSNRARMDSRISLGRILKLSLGTSKESNEDQVQ